MVLKTSTDLFLSIILDISCQKQTMANILNYMTVIFIWQIFVENATPISAVQIHYKITKILM